jgi:hypothetical protein
VVVKLSTKFLAATLTSATSAYGHSLVAAWLANEHQRHFSSWASNVACASFILCAVMALGTVVSTVEGK